MNVSVCGDYYTTMNEYPVLLHISGITNVTYLLETVKFPIE